MTMFPGRTGATDDAYRERARTLCARYTACTGVTWEQDPEGLVAWVAQLTQVRPATVRQYRSALAFWLESHGASNAAQAMRRVQPVLAHVLPCRTSRAKLKKVPPDDFRRLVKYFSDSRSRRPEGRWDRLLALWLFCGRATGLRPGEWETAQWLDNPPRLQVQNAKHTNGRAFGPLRTLWLDGLPPQQQHVIQQFLRVLHAHPHFRQAQLGCQHRLSEVNRRFWPRRRRHITLYSLRHQFAANAKKAGLPLCELAALMGHASPDTIQEHYGRRSAGRSGFAVRPDPADVTRVQTLLAAADLRRQTPAPNAPI